MNNSFVKAYQDWFSLGFFPIMDTEYKFMVGMLDKMRCLDKEALLFCLINFMGMYQRLVYSEEQMMLKSDYPNMARHVKAHDGILVALSTIYVTVRRDASGEPLKVLWTTLVDHLTNEDIEMTQYLQKWVVGGSAC